MEESNDLNPPVVEAPRIILDEDADTTVSRRVRRLEQTIEANPSKALSTLGSLVLSQSIELSRIDQREATLRRNVRDLLTEYFEQRYDLAVSFDDATEKAIEQDEDYQSLINQHRSSSNQQVQLGVQKKGSRADPNAEPIRDRVRRKRLELYIGRVMSYQHTQAADKAHDLHRAI